MRDNDKSLESGESTKYLNNEKKRSKACVITLEEAVSSPKKDRFKEKKMSKGYAGTAQDIEWRRLEEPEDCSRRQINYWYRSWGEYEN